MLRWLKYFPYAHTRNNNASELDGPYFPKPRPNRWILGDNALFFNAPWVNPVLSLNHYGKPMERIDPGRADILQTAWEPVYANHSSAPEFNWNMQVFYEKTWYFTGPWFTGFQAQLRAFALLITPDKNSVFSDKNFFHPRIFESALSSYLDARFGYEKNGRSAHYRGPMNWETKKISSSIQAVVCDIHTIGNTSKEHPSAKRYIFIPIASQQIIQICFDLGGTLINDEKLKVEHQFALCNTIIQSIKLEVGPKTQTEWNKVRETCPDMSITKSMGEFPWPLKIDKPSKKPIEVDITPGKRHNTIESK